MAVKTPPEQPQFTEGGKVVRRNHRPHQFPRDPTKIDLNIHCLQSTIHDCLWMNRRVGSRPNVGVNTALWLGSAAFARSRTVCGTLTEENPALLLRFPRAWSHRAAEGTHPCRTGHRRRGILWLFDPAARGANSRGRGRAFRPRPGV